jgi:hypothetical protein
MIGFQDVLEFESSWRRDAVERSDSVHCGGAPHPGHKAVVPVRYMKMVCVELSNIINNLLPSPAPRTPIGLALPAVKYELVAYLSWNLGERANRLPDSAVLDPLYLGLVRDR